jgi:hypothetical protein
MAEPRFKKTKQPRFKPAVPDSPDQPDAAPPESQMSRDVKDFGNEFIGGPLNSIGNTLYGLATSPVTLPAMVLPTIEDDVRYALDRTLGTHTTLSTQEAADRDRKLAEYVQPVRTGQKWLEDNVLPAPSQSMEGQKVSEAASWLVPGSWPTKATRAAEGMTGKLSSYGSDLLANGVLPAIGATTAEGLTGSKLAGLVAGLGTGVGTAFARAWHAPDEVLRMSAKGTTPAQFDAMRALEERNRAVGVRSSGPELHAEVRGSSPLTNVMRSLEGSPIVGRRVTGPFFADRPQQFETANQHLADSITPQAAPDPMMLGPRANDAADEVVRGVMRDRSDATEPFFERANSVNVPRAAVDSIIGQIDQSIAGDTTGHLAGPLGEYRQGLIAEPGQPAVPEVAPGPRGEVRNPDGSVRYHTPGTPRVPAVPAVPERPATDIANLDRNRKVFRERLAPTTVDPNRPPLTGETADLIGGYNRDLTDEMRNASPDFQQGQDLHGQITEAVVRPVTNGPVGTVQKAPGTVEAGNAILPHDPVLGAAQGVGGYADAVGRLFQQDPATTLQLIRHNLGQRFNKALTSTQEMVQEFAGPKFYVDVAGNPARRETLDAVLGAVRGQPLLDTAENVLTAFRTSGRRKQIGSATEFNQQMTDHLDQSPASTGASLALTQGGSWPVLLGDFLRRWALRGNQTKLAEILTSRDATSRIEQALARGPQYAGPELAVRSGMQALNQLFVQPNLEERR